jgi:hypothetical protein
MEKSLIKLLFVRVVFFSTFSVSAQIYVKVRPVVPIVVKTTQPSPAHVWVDEEWEPNGETYRYRGGYWESPPHNGYNWRRGHWRRHHNNSEEWVPGHWAK